MSGPVLFVAAEAREFSGLIRHCAGVERMAWPLDFARRGVLKGRQVVMVANGAGPRLAAEAVEVAQAKTVASVVVSTGYCGALDPEYHVGDIVVADQIVAEDEVFAVYFPTSVRPHRIGTVLSMDRVAGTPEEKRRLRAAGPVAVEMESAGVARRVRQWKVPICCIRVVTDTSEQGFSLDLNACRLPDGRFSAVRIVVSALRRPFVGIPELLRLQRTSQSASRALGDFLADCSF
jgi:adenosylhomocysteine nucleosidase